MKSPATKKQDVLLEDIVPSSTISPPTVTNIIFGITQQCPASPGVNNIHVFNDNDNKTVQENEQEGHPKVIAVAKQATHTAMESELVSRTTTEMVNLDHTMEFQECMDTCKIHNGVHSFDTIAWLLHFVNPPVTFVLLSQRVLQTNNHQQYSCKQHLGCNFHISFG